MNENKFVEKNVDKKKFYLERRIYLESCVKSLREKFNTNINIHKSDNKRIMGGKQICIKCFYKSGLYWLRWEFTNIYNLLKMIAD